MGTNFYSFIRRSFFAGIVMMLFVMGADAQSNWALPSSRWEMVETSCGYQGPCSYRHFLATVIDTPVIAGISCSHVRLSYSHSWPSDYYTYESGDTVYFYVDSAFRPTFYLNAHVGDSLLYHRKGNAHVDFYGTVDSVRFIIQGTDTLKHFYTHLLYNTNITVVYAEKIGLINGPFTAFYPLFSYQADGDAVWTCNYGDDSLLNYWFYPTNACDVPVYHYSAVNEVASGNTSLVIFPNPSSGTITINMSGVGSGIKTVHLYDQLGQVVYTGKTDRSELALDLHLAGGMYEVEVMADGSSGRGKVAVE